MGDESVGEFYSVALTNNYQQADTGTKMIHIGKNTRSTIVSKGHQLRGKGQATYRGLVKVRMAQTGSKNYTRCDSMLIGSHCGGSHGSRTLTSATLRVAWNTRPRPRRSAMISSSSVASEA